MWKTNIHSQEVQGPKASYSVRYRTQATPPGATFRDMFPCLSQEIECNTFPSSLGWQRLPQHTDNFRNTSRPISGAAKNARANTGHKMMSYIQIRHLGLLRVTAVLPFFGFLVSASLSSLPLVETCVIPSPITKPPQICMYVCMYVRTYVCLFVCLLARVHRHTHTHIYI